MTVVSLLVYRLDEFMETIFRTNTGFEDREKVRRIIRELCEFDSQKMEAPNGRAHTGLVKQIGNETNGGSASATSSDPLHHTRAVLRSFTSYILQHPAVIRSPNDIQKQLHQELCRCMLAHISQAEDNCRVASQQKDLNAGDQGPSKIVTFTSAQATYYSWVQGRSLVHC
ncbi:hypothetical protein GGR52DRAFT_561251 [Hypoxylon sp. FL1284]|nr:hypothetical protein GGR52DRAFT_561251 [Hypoxylon sp. FL1284]